MLKINDKYIAHRYLQSEMLKPCRTSKILKSLSSDFSPVQFLTNDIASIINLSQSQFLTNNIAYIIHLLSRSQFLTNNIAYIIHLLSRIQFLTNHISWIINFQNLKLSISINACSTISFLIILDRLIIFAKLSLQWSSRKAHTL